MRFAIGKRVPEGFGDSEDEQLFVDRRPTEAGFKRTKLILSGLAAVLELAQNYAWRNADVLCEIADGVPLDVKTFQLALKFRRDHGLSGEFVRFPLFCA